MLAAAYARELVFGKVVAGLQSPFDVSATRGLVERCLDNHALTPFPHDPDRGCGKRRTVVRVTVDVNGVNVIM